MCVCERDSHVGMELLALKHERLFQGPVETPCPRPSPPEQEEKGPSSRSHPDSCSTAETHQDAANAAA